MSMHIKIHYKSKWRKRFSKVDGAHNSAFSSGMKYRNFAGYANHYP